jgi:hypothetical protein
MRRLEKGDVSAAWQEIVDRLDDFGLPPESTETPSEVAAGVAAVMEPLAAVYGERLYGDPDRERSGTVATARSSLEETERALAFRHRRSRRIRARYRVTSILPGWIRRRLRRP